MKIGKASHVRTAISTSNADAIIVRGRNLSDELIGHVNFGDYFHLLLTGRMPDAATSAVLNATLVAIAEHGLVPSNQAARMTYAAAPEAMQGAVAAGLLGAGSVVFGSSEVAGRLFLRVEQEAKQHSGDIHAAAHAVVSDLRAKRQSIPGYGHPEHKERDPRVDALFNVSLKAGAPQKYVDIAKAIEGVIPGIVGRELKLNVSAGIPAVLLDVGFPVNALKGVPILARTASLIAHLNEEIADPVGFALAYQALNESEYTGDVPAGFKAK